MGLGPQGGTWRRSLRFIWRDLHGPQQSSGHEAACRDGGEREMEIRGGETVTKRSGPIVPPETRAADDVVLHPRVEADQTAAAATGTGTPDPAAIRIVRLFANLPDDDLAWIAAHSERLTLDPGGIFMHAGEPADWMYLALDGVLQLRREQLGPNMPSFVI